MILTFLLAAAHAAPLPFAGTMPVKPSGDWEPRAKPAGTAARGGDDEFDRLEREMLRFEAELIRKELNRLAAQDEPAGAERVVRLGTRLKQVRERLGSADTQSTSTPKLPPKTVGGPIIPIFNGKIGPFVEAASSKPVALPPLPRADTSLPPGTPVTTPPGWPAIPAIPTGAPAAPPPHAPARR